MSRGNVWDRASRAVGYPPVTPPVRNGLHAYDTFPLPEATRQEIVTAVVRVLEAEDREFDRLKALHEEATEKNATLAVALRRALDEIDSIERHDGSPPLEAVQDALAEVRQLVTGFGGVL